MPKNDYICLTCNRQCEICTFLKWICELRQQGEEDYETESIIG